MRQNGLERRLKEAMRYFIARLNETALPSSQKRSDSLTLLMENLNTHNFYYIYFKIVFKELIEQFYNVYIVYFTQDTKTFKCL